MTIVPVKIFKLEIEHAGNFNSPPFRPGFVVWTLPVLPSTDLFRVGFPEPAGREINDPLLMVGFSTEFLQ